jgi:regulator of sigma E protease
MVGGVTVNLLLGFLIYILVVFTWGQTELNPNKLSNGLSIHPYLAKYHLVSGDKVISIENEPLTNLDELNKGILLRDKRNLVVQHVNGKVEKIKLPENIDTELFQAGAFPPFGLRSKSNIVESVVKKSPAEKAGLKKSDVILSVNGHEIIFFDDFATENLGDFPVQWNTNSSGEIVTIAKYPGRWFQMKGGGFYIPEAREKMTENYTIDFDFITLNVHVRTI